MDLLITPTQLSRRAELYYQLGSLISAGVYLPNAIRQLKENPPSRSYREPLGLILEKVEEGLPFCESVRATGWLSPFDQSLLSAGEMSGRLDVSFKLLSKYYEQKAEMTRKTIGGLAYPVLLLHTAILLYPVSLLIEIITNGNFLPWILDKVKVLVPFYVLVIGSVLFFKLNRADPLLEFIERVVRKIPFLGKAQRSMALARLSVSLESLLNAGVTVIEAWQLAALSSGSVMVKKEVQGWKERMENGETPSGILNQSRNFPEMFKNLYATAEISGQQDVTLQRLGDYYHEESARKFKNFTKMITSLVFAAAALYVALTVIGVVSNYGKQVQNAIGPE